jgi:hypothetical protein
MFSATIVSILRLKSLVDFAASANPTYDNVPTAYWSVLSCMMGIFCACMPALRRLSITIAPNCFASTEKDSKYNPYDATPNPRISGAHMSGGRKNHKGNSDFAPLHDGSGITKTIETTIVGKNNEDEVELVQLRNTAKGSAFSSR